MFNTDTIQGGIGLIFAGIGLSGIGAVALIATAAALLNGVLLLVSITARVVLAIIHHKQGKTTNEQFIKELLDISTEAKRELEVFDDELSKRDK